MTPVQMGPGFFIFFRNPERIGGDDAPPLIKYEKPAYENFKPHFIDLPEKTIKQVSKKIEVYVEAKQLNPESINAIVESMVDVLTKKEIRKMNSQRLERDQFLESYRESLRQFIQEKRFEEELALILILASI